MYQPYQPNLNQYQNPMYFQQQQMAAQMPYNDRLSQLQMQQAQLQGFNPMCKMVESIDIVKSTDIPIDGNVYYFPKADGSEIFTKRWLSNGQTQIISYKPVLENQQSIAEEKSDNLILSNELMEMFMDKLNGIMDKVDKLEKSMKPSGRKKEEVKDE